VNSGHPLQAPGDQRGGRFRVLILAENDAVRAGLLGLLSEDAEAEIFYPKTESDVVDLLRRHGEGVVLQGETQARPAQYDYETKTASPETFHSGKFLVIEGIRLTKLQARVLRMVVSGTGNKEIAAVLSKTVPSIKRTIQHLFTKFGVRTRAQLAVIGSRAEQAATRADGFRS